MGSDAGIAARRGHVVGAGKSLLAAGLCRWLHRRGVRVAPYDDLRSRFDVVVCEGAGSPAEINLRATDLSNMGLADARDLPVVVVADIDRGGVFAGVCPERGEGWM